MSEDNQSFSCKSFETMHTDSDDQSVLTKTDDSISCEVTKLRLEMALMRVEMNDTKNEVNRTDEPLFKTSLTGAWKIVGSENMSEYLLAHGASDLFNVVFQLADVHIEFNENTVAMFHQVGDKKYHEKSFELSRPQFFGNIACVSYICDDCLKTVYLRNGEENEEEIEKRLLREGRLHVVIKRYGVQCIRIYEKINQDGKSATERKAEEFQKKYKDLSDINDKLLSEKLELRKELDVLKVMDSAVQVRMTIEKQKNFQKKYLDLTDVHGKLLEETGHLREDNLKLQQELEHRLSLSDQLITMESSLKESLSVLCSDPYEQLKSRLRTVYFEFEGRYGKHIAEHKIEEIKNKNGNLEARMEAIKEEIARVEEDPRFIKNSIVGQWQNVKNFATYSLIVNNNVFIDYREVSTFGVPNSKGFYYVIEKNTIVNKKQGSPNWREEYFIENDQLVIFYVHEKQRDVFKRIGDPQ